MLIATSVALCGAALCGAALCTAAPAPAAPEPVAPGEPNSIYILGAVWISEGGLATLRVHPSPAGRIAAAGLGKTGQQAQAAWQEVLAAAPDADTNALRAQFVCHWNFAELAEPGKPSWDLEAWRPDVDDNAMVLTGCNPGGPEVLGD